MIRKPLILSLLNFMGRFINFILYLLIANLYGASQSTDWFFFVYAIAYFFIGISYYATENALVPAWHRLPETDHPKMFRSAIHLSLYALPVIGLLLVISGFFLAPRRGISLPDSTAVALLICLALACQPSLAFLSSLFSSYRQYRQRYILPTIHLSLRTIGVLAVLLLVHCRTVVVLSFAYLAGEVVRFLCLQHGQFQTRKLFKSIASAGNFLWPVYKHVAWMTMALMCMVINPVIDMAMVGKFGGGSLTLVEYAGRLRGMPVLALGGLLVYFLGEWSYQHHQQDRKLAWQRVNKTFLKLIAYCFPAVILLMISEKLWVPLIFFSKKFSSADLYVLRQLLYWYFPGVVFLAGSMILSRAILVVQQAKLMAFVTLIAAGLNVFLNMVLLKMMGLSGVALSTTMVDVFVCFAYYLVARRLLNIPHRTSVA
jgi:putative peptidoglycan lipid II flippase